MVAIDLVEDEIKKFFWYFAILKFTEYEAYGSEIREN